MEVSILLSLTVIFFHLKFSGILCSRVSNGFGFYLLYNKTNGQGPVLGTFGLARPNNSPLENNYLYAGLVSPKNNSKKN